MADSWQSSRMRVRGMRRNYLFPLFVHFFGCYLKTLSSVSTNLRSTVEVWFFGCMGLFFSYEIKYP